MPLTPKLKQHIAYVASICEGIEAEWPIVKRMIVSCFAPHERKGIGFSRRHETTRKLFLNETDKEAIAYWKELTGVDLKLDPNHLHDLSWVYRPQGWGLPSVRHRYEPRKNQ